MKLLLYAILYFMWICVPGFGSNGQSDGPDRTAPITG